MTEIESVLHGIRYAVFDFDGTLMDSMPSWCRKMLFQLDEAGISYPDDIIARITPMGDVRAAAYFQTLGLQKSVEEIVASMHTYALDAYANRILPKEGVVPLLQVLQQKGIAMCVLTASPRDMITPCLARNGMTDFFTFTCSCDEVGMEKTQTEIYTATAKRLGGSVADCLFFDDNYLALKTAREAGMKTVGVFDATSAADERKIRAVATYYIYTFNELR